MSEPTNPRKRALMPSGKLRKALRAAGHHLAPIVQVGKEGATEAVLRQLDEALLAHELVKVKVGAESPEDRFEVAGRIAEQAGVQVAQVLGRTVLVYRKHPEKPRFEAAEAKPSPREREAAPARTRKTAPPRRPPPRRGTPERREPPDRRGSSTQRSEPPRRRGPPKRRARPGGGEPSSSGRRGGSRRRQ